MPQVRPSPKAKSNRRKALDAVTNVAAHTIVSLGKLKPSARGSRYHTPEYHDKSDSGPVFWGTRKSEREQDTRDWQDMQLGKAGDAYNFVADRVKSYKRKK